MALTQIDWGRQIQDLSINREKLNSNFLDGVDLNITDGNNDATITWLSSPVNPNDAVNKTYVDLLVDGSLKAPEGYDPTVTSDYPLTYGGDPIQAGDSFRITADGSMGTRTVNVEDLLIAIVDWAGATTDADWMVAESNRSQATETELGLLKISTQVIADAGTNDTDAITPLKLATYLSNAGIVKVDPEYFGEAPVVTGGSAVLPALSNLGTSGVQNVRVYLNGQRQEVGSGNDYTIALATGVITFNANLSATDVVLVDYQEDNS